MKVLKISLIVVGLVFVLLCLSLTVYNGIGNSSVELRIKGLGTRLLILSYQSVSNKCFKIVPCIDGKMSVKVDINELCGARITTLGKNAASRANQIRFFIEPGDNIVIQGNVKTTSIDYNVIEGNALSKQYSELQRDLCPLFEEEFDLKMRFKRNHLKEDKKLLDSIIRIAIPNRKLDFVRKHLSYELTADLLNEDRFVSRDTIVKYSKLLTENVRNHEFGVMLALLIKGWNNTKTGTIAPLFSQGTSDGTPFSLSSLRGRYVVLDFWGSWCSACLKDLPNMKIYYNKFKHKIDFVGIVCHDSKSTLEDMIKKYQIEWPNVLDDKKLNDIEMKYGISSFPTKIIIDKKGRIIRKVAGESQYFYQVVDSLVEAGI